MYSSSMEYLKHTVTTVHTVLANIDMDVQAQLYTCFRSFNYFNFFLRNHVCPRSFAIIFRLTIAFTVYCNS